MGILERGSIKSAIFNLLAWEIGLVEI